LRAAGETLSVLCYIVALARMPIADVIAILQTAPLILILAVAFLLRERVGAARVALALVGFAGAFLVAQPGPAGISPAALLAFASALFIAACDLVGRDVPARIPVMVVTFATNVMVMVVAAVLSLVSKAGKRQGTGISRFSASLACLSRSDMSDSARLSARADSRGRTLLLQLRALAVLSGLLVFGVLPSALALMGIALIAGSGVAIVLLDQRRGEEIALTEAL
jgi:drug/metabolite transporter (DMT)-like permease